LATSTWTTTPDGSDFRNELASIEEPIRQRNQQRRPYVFLVPSGIPQSINI
jgi:hypothetical protein